MDSFGRQTSSGRVIPEVDGLRFIAIVLVLCFHVYGSVPDRPATAAQSMAQAYLLQALSVGSFGVQIFFFLSSFIPHLPYFALGLFFADLYVLNPQVFRRAGILWDLVGLIGFVAMIAMLSTGMHRAVVPWVLGVFCVALFKGLALNRLCTLPVVVAIGAMSCTVYLYHYLFVLGVGRALQSAFGKNASLGTLGIHCVAIAGTTLLICPLLFWLFERPFMDKDWHSRLLARLGVAPTMSGVSGE